MVESVHRMFINEAPQAMLGLVDQMKPPPYTAAESCEQDFTEMLVTSHPAIWLGTLLARFYYPFGGRFIKWISENHTANESFTLHPHI